MAHDKSPDPRCNVFKVTRATRKLHESASRRHELAHDGSQNARGSVFGVTRAAQNPNRKRHVGTQQIYTNLKAQNRPAYFV